MAGRKIREEAKKPDMVTTFLADSINWIKANPKAVIAGGFCLVLVVGIFLGFRAYRNGQEERTQYLLFQGLRSYQEFAIGARQDSVKNAESSFAELARRDPKGLGDIARLYLGKIRRDENKTDEARSYYTQITRGMADPLIKRFASSALRDLGTAP